MRIAFCLLVVKYPKRLYYPDSIETEEFNISGSVAEGLGFAIPIKTISAIGWLIMQKEFYPRPYLGITWQAIYPNNAARYDCPVDWGPYVTDVSVGSPASKGGLKPGDMITKIGNDTIDKTHSYHNVVFLFKLADQVRVESMRINQTIQTQVTLVETKNAGQ